MPKVQNSTEKNEHYEKVDAYRCLHCSEVAEGEDLMLEHQEECIYNPENKKCMMCKHLYAQGFVTPTGVGMINYRCDKFKKVLGQKDFDIRLQKCFELTETKEIPIRKTEDYIKWEKKEIKKLEKSNKRQEKNEKELEEFRHSMNLLDEYNKNPDSFKDLIDKEISDKFKN